MKQKADCRIGFNLAIHFPAIVRFSYLLRMSLAYDLAFGKNETVRNGTVNSRSLTRSCISCIDTCLACLHAFLERSSAENSIPGGREREKNSKRNGKGQWRVSFSRVSLSRFPGLWIGECRDQPWSRWVLGFSPRHSIIRSLLRTLKVRVCMYVRLWYIRYAGYIYVRRIWR